MRRGSHPPCRPLPRDFYLGIHWHHVETPQCNVQENLLSGLSCSLFVRHYWGNPLQFRLLRSLICLNSAGGPVHAQVSSSNCEEHCMSVPGQCIGWHVTPGHLPDHTLFTMKCSPPPRLYRVKRAMETSRWHFANVTLGATLSQTTLRNS